MSKYLLIITFALTNSFLFAQDVYIPDFRFEEALLAHIPKIDINNDSKIQVSEAKAVQILLVSNRSIKSLVGIESFTSCTILDCTSNSLDSLDLSKNIVLNQLYCGNNQLTKLNISKNTNLILLSCSSNNLNYLDVRQNTALSSLSCNSNVFLYNICISSAQETIIASNPNNWIKDPSAKWSTNCSILTSIDKNYNSNNSIKSIIRVVNQLGQEIPLEKAVEGIFIFQYSDGSIQKIAK